MAFFVFGGQNYYNRRIIEKTWWGYVEMNIKRYKFEENVLDRELFAADGLAFSVLYNIVNKKCTLVLTDHERFIICYSAFPFPVWIWNVADITEEEKEQIWQISL